MFNFEKWGLEDPVSWGMPPIPRDRLITCDEYSSNYKRPCTERGEIHKLNMKVVR